MLIRSKKVLVCVEKETEGGKRENINGNRNERLNEEMKGNINERQNEEMKGKINENIKENINENINKGHKKMESKEGVKEILVTQEIIHYDTPTENQIFIPECDFVNQV